MNVPARSARHLLAREVRLAEAELDLARASLLIAREEYPQLSVEQYLTRLDQLAEGVLDRLGEETAPLLVLQELLSFLFEKQGFRGNRDAYYDPRNSFLNDVLDRRLGIPLTLGIVVLETGWRLGLPLEGVSFPHHFLVRFRGDAVDLLIDPYDAGTLRFEDQAQELLDRVYGGMVVVRDAFLQRATKRDMLTRLLTNLKGLYLNVREDERALTVVDRLLLLRPGSPDDRRTRGILLARLGRSGEAAEALEDYLGAAPDAADAGQIEDLLGRLRRGDTGKAG